MRSNSGLLQTQCQPRARNTDSTRKQHKNRQALIHFHQRLLSLRPLAVVYKLQVTRQSPKEQSCRTDCMKTVKQTLGVSECFFQHTSRKHHPSLLCGYQHSPWGSSKSGTIIHLLIHPRRIHPRLISNIGKTRDVFDTETQLEGQHPRTQNDSC